MEKGNMIAKAIVASIGIICISIVALVLKNVGALWGLLLVIPIIHYMD